ncbi:MAG: phosphatidate cytidylyltransferase, partial [Anaerolineales bacterium]
MLKARVLSAAVLLPVVIISIILGGWYFPLFIVVTSFLACAEYVQMLKLKSYTLGLPAVLALCAVWQANAVWSDGEWFVPAFAAIVALITFWELIQRHMHPEKIDPSVQWALILAGGLYIGIGSSFLIRLRALNDGLWWTLTALPIIWVSESGAYFIGKRYGNHKMSPSISPGKSWEGYVAQVTSGILTGGIVGWLLPIVTGNSIGLNIWTGMGMGVLLSALSTVGDFFVSMIKREVGVKDSGSLIPGHGGVFD